MTKRFGYDAATPFYGEPQPYEKEIARLVAAKESAERERDDVLANIYSRDDWIVQQGLWDQFVKEVDGARNTVDALVARVGALEEALKPFAEYAPSAPPSVFPNDAPFTQGSPLAKRQLTFGDLRRARAVLDASKKEL